METRREGERRHRGCSAAVGRQTVVFTGRFQPPHLGHVQTICHIVEEYRLPLIVGICEVIPRNDVGQRSADSYGEDFLDILVPERLQPCNNPISYHDRLRMLRDVCEHALPEANIEFVPILRPPLEWWDVVTRLLPSERVWALPKPRTDWEAGKIMLLRAQGEEVWEFNCPQDPYLTSSQVRESIRSGADSWMEMVPSAVRRHLLARPEVLRRIADPSGTTL